MDKKPDKLNFGIMTHGMVLSKWQYECIKHLQGSGIAEAKLIINDASVSEIKNSLLQKLKNYLNKHFVYKISSRFLFKLAAFENIPVNNTTIKKVIFFIFIIYLLISICMDDF